MLGAQEPFFIQDPKRKKAFLLHYASQGVRDIFDTVTESPTAAKAEIVSAHHLIIQIQTHKQLNWMPYFNRKMNPDYEAYVFCFKNNK